MQKVFCDKCGDPVGDLLELRAWSEKHHYYIEPYSPIVKRVTYVLSGWGLKEGYVCLGLGGECADE